MDFKFVGNHVEIDPPKKTKKMTGTRFASVLGLNRWSTPFQMWSQVTKLYEPPFEGTIYTEAGKVIEPKICEYLRKRYFMDIKTPEDVYGADYFKKTWGDFFKDNDVFGGMWDFIGEDFVVEVKTTKRAEDWINGDKVVIPPYYKLQAALYAYLLKMDDVIVTVSFLTDADYTNPEAFKPTVENTKIIPFKMSEDFPDFYDRYIYPALAWWAKHVATGVSPEFDEKLDAEYLKGLRTNVVEGDVDIEKAIAKAEKLQASIDLAEAKIADKRAELKKIEGQIKNYMIEQFRDGDKKTELRGKKYVWTVTKAVRKSLDSDKVLEFLDGMDETIDDYMKTTETMTLKKKAIEEE